MTSALAPTRPARQGRPFEATEVAESAAGAWHALASRCTACARAVFPPVTVCPFCLNEPCERFALDAPGTLYSFSQVHVAPAPWQVPYFVGYADFAPDLRVFAKLDPAVEWAPDVPVRLHVERLDAAQGTPAYSFFLGEA